MRRHDRNPPLPSRKRFGQNFLIDRNIIHRIVSAIDPQPDDDMVEIGPGHGELTAELHKAGCRLEVIEIDRDLIAGLRARFPDLPVTESDVLKFDFSTMTANAKAREKRLRIVGNLPYNISTPLLFKLFGYLDDIRDMHFMLQLEVVERMVARPCGGDYGRLSVMAQYYCRIDKLFTVPPTAFTPRPRVMSAVARLTPRTDGCRAENTGILARIVNAAFSQRRKTLRNALKAHLSANELVSLSLDPGARPENLDVSDFVRCANLIATRAARCPEEQS